MKLHPGHKTNRALCLVQIHYAIHDMLTQTCKQTYFVRKTNLVIIWSITSKIFMNYTPWLISVDHFTKGFWAHNWIIVKIRFALSLILMIQSGHNFAHVMTALLSWHVQNCDLMKPWFFNILLKLLDKMCKYEMDHLYIYIFVQDLDYELWYPL